ncbi:MAG TPA: hypothetical protein VFA75_06430 [Nevskia sp.]|nr:hypothetical protein [Nevskia sp.]
MNPAIRLAAGAALLLSGCGLSPVQKDQVAAFASATAQVGAATAAQFTQLRQDVVEMNADELALGDPRQLNPYTFRFDEPLGAEPITRRVLAVNALQAYGEALDKLAGADQSAGIRQSATDLVSSFNAAAAADLTSAQQASAADLVASLGGFFVEYQKKRAVAKIVRSYACPVDQLAQLLERDFLNFGTDDDARLRPYQPSPVLAGCPFHSPRGDRAVGVLYGYESVAGRLKNAAANVLSGNAPFDKRQRATAALLRATRNLDKGQAVGEGAGKALRALRKANAGLVQSVGDDQLRVEDIKAYAAAAKQLLASLKVLANR